MTEKSKDRQEVAVATKEPSDVKALISSDAYKKQFAIALPRHLKPERFIRIALTAITKNPKLAQCTQASLIGCLLDLSQMGLEPDGRRAHLIPFNNNKTGKLECTLIVDYKGLVELAMNTKEVSNIHADVVCDNDVFIYNVGLVEKHEIDFRADRGKMYAVYCIIAMKDGTKKCEVMTRADVDSIRKRSKSAGTGPWVTDYNEMAKKTVFRRASKWIKLSPEVREKIEKGDDVILGIDAPETIEEPLIGLKHDKAVKEKEAQPADKQESASSAPGEVVDAEMISAEWDDFGDPERFGTSGKGMIANIKKCADRLGKEKFLIVLGKEGWTSIKEISKVPDLAKITTALLDAVTEAK